MLSSTPFLLVMQWYGWISHMIYGILYVTCLAESDFLVKSSHLQNYLPRQIKTSEYCCLNFMQFVSWVSYQPSFYLVLDCLRCTVSTAFISVLKDCSTIHTCVTSLSQKYMETLRIQVHPFSLLLLVEHVVLSSYDGRVQGGRVLSVLYVTRSQTIHIEVTIAVTEQRLRETAGVMLQRGLVVLG